MDTLPFMIKLFTVENFTIHGIGLEDMYFLIHIIT